ncbi:GAF domain-containing protein [bacterium]|nr:GAF domain-containing protein [bacterium]
MNKTEQYQNIYTAFSALLKAPVADYVHMNNLCALLKKEFHFFWVGFYLRQGEENLQIGPYQGEVPCFDIKIGKGVCGTAAAEKSTQVVADVHAFPGYIACHPEPNSEIVVPGLNDGNCVFVLDIDHVDKNYFDAVDQEWLEKLCALVVEKLN